MNAPTWRVLGASVRGAAHERSGLPNQDHISWYPKRAERYGPPLVLAVADGHGSPKCFRSEVGSEIASRRAKEAFRQIFKADLPPLDLTKVKRLLEERMPRDLVQSWQDSVRRNLDANPLAGEEFDRLAAKEGPAAVQKVKENPFLAYGTTLLVAVVTGAYAAFLQLGDGDTLLVSDSGEVSRPLPKDERLIANETTSLASDKAWQDFRTGFLPLAGAPPALILLSTDGYSNSFGSEASFLQVGKDLLDFLRTDGPRQVRCSLPGWLKEASTAGSGDDITMGIIYRQDAVSAGWPGGAADLTKACPDESAATGQDH